MDNNNNYNAHIWYTCACTKCTSTKLHLLHCSIASLHCSAKGVWVIAEEMYFLPCSLLHHLSALLCKISFLHKMTLHLWLSARYHNFKASLSSQNIIADALFRYAELYISSYTWHFYFWEVLLLKWFVCMFCFLNFLWEKGPFLVPNIVTFADSIHQASLENVLHCECWLGWLLTPLRVIVRS